MTTYYKAVRFDYASFNDPEFMYGPIGTVVKHPHYDAHSEDAADYLSVSTEPTDCTGFQWRVDGKDSRLLIVEPVGEVRTPHPESLPNKRAVEGVKVVGELPISAAFGPNAAKVAEFLAKLPTLTNAQWDAARDAAWDAARAAARDAAWAAAWAAAWDAARAAAWDAERAAAWAAEAIIVRDLITPEQFEILTGPMRAAGVTFE